MKESAEFGPESKIDLALYLCSHLSDTENNSTNLSYENNKKIIYYFLKENFTSIFGKYILSVDEIDRVAHDDKVVINTIFGTEIIAYCVETEIGLQIIGKVKGNEVFSITIFNNTVVNELIEEKNNEYRKTVYRVNTSDNTCSLSIESSKDNQKEFITDFKAKLAPINTRISHCDLFELTRIVPVSEEQSTSFLKRIVDSLRNDNLVKIPTTGDEEPNDLLEPIFGKLKELNIQTNNKKKNLVQ